MKAFFRFLIRKALTRPIWTWETKRSYPIRDKVFDLPPVALSTDQDALHLVVLTTPDRLNNAAWAAWSLARNLERPPRLTLVIDGTPDPSLIERIRKLLPGMGTEDATEISQRIAHDAPSVSTYARSHPLGRKLAAILHFHESSHVLYSDDDILAFRPLTEIDAALRDGVPVNRYMREHGGNMAVDPCISQGALANGMSWVTDLNAGFAMVRRNSLDPKLCERVLAASPPSDGWFAETLLFAVLLARSPHQPFPDTTYITNTQRQFYFEQDVDYDKIVLRHFVTPVRHLMYSRGMPILSRSSLS